MGHLTNCIYDGPASYVLNHRQVLHTMEVVAAVAHSDPNPLRDWIEEVRLMQLLLLFLVFSVAVFHRQLSFMIAIHYQEYI